MKNMVVSAVVILIGLLFVLFSLWSKLKTNQRHVQARLLWCNGAKNVDMGRLLQKRTVKNHATFCYEYRVNNKRYTRIDQACINPRSVPKNVEFQYIRGFPQFTFAPGASIGKPFLVGGIALCLIGSLLFFTTL